MPDVSVRHNFETGHRLPHLAGKCTSLHGHSWWAEVTASAPALEQGLVLDFGGFKSELRQWIDLHLDHGVMLGTDDPLVPVLQAHGTKVFVMPGGAWPTVENVAALIAERARQFLLISEGFELMAPGTHITRVHVTETHVNSATWTPTGARA